MGAQLNIFAIYTSEDKEILLHLLNHLKPFENDFNVSIWHDDAIHPGQLWKPQIESHLQEADIFLLLVSNTFMYSEFVKQLEFKIVIDRYKDDNAKVIPIIIDYCQWEIDFKSDDYDFNLNELQVLPEGAKPVKTWDSPNQAYENIAASIKSVIRSITGDNTQQESEKEEEAKVDTGSTEEQIALSFNEEKEAEEAKKRIEEVEAKRKADEEKKRKEEAEAKRRIEEENSLREEAKAKKIEEERQRHKEEIDAKKRAEEERRLREEAETRRKSEEEKRFQEEAEAKGKIDQENRGEERDKEQPYPIKVKEMIEKAWYGYSPKIKKRVLAALLVVVLATLVIRTCSKNNTVAEEQTDPMQAADTIAVKDSIVLEETEVDVPKKEEVLSTLEIGDTFEDGFVFEIDDKGETGKIAHIDDAGPMTWKNAMNIHEELGEGWRLPTFDELLLMQKTIGQGATNRGEFSDGLYWSATDYDEYQARLVRFRDANRSYHYNKEAEHRKFRVRAIRDFSR